MNPRRSGVAAVVAAVCVVFATSAGAVGSRDVYNATPRPLPPNVASLGFEVTVTMSDWALYADYSTDIRYAGNSATWTHPVRVNVYSSHLGANHAPDTLL